MTVNNKVLPFVFGFFLALTAVILGAFGAHALKEWLDPVHLASFETGVRYQMYHGFALIALGLKQHVLPTRFDRAAGTLMVTGTIFFSCSIYLLSTAAATGMSWTWLGPVTPLGGTLLIIGWTLLLVDAIRLLSKKGL